MAVAVSSVVTVFDGPTRVKHAKITFDSSYPTGGETLTASTFGLSSIIGVIADSGDGYTFEYNAPKLLAYWVDTTTDGAPLVQVANTTDLSAVACQAIVIGH